MATTCYIHNKTYDDSYSCCPECEEQWQADKAGGLKFIPDPFKGYLDLYDFGAWHTLALIRVQKERAGASAEEIRDALNKRSAIILAGLQAGAEEKDQAKANEKKVLDSLSKPLF